MVETAKGYQVYFEKSQSIKDNLRGENNRVNKSSILIQWSKKILPKADESRNAVQTDYLDTWGYLQEKKKNRNS